MDLFKAEMDKEYKALGLKDRSKSLSVRPQVGRSIAKIDKKRKALVPGKRMSSAGKVYYEYRKNRSDSVGKMI